LATNFFARLDQPRFVSPWRHRDSLTGSSVDVDSQSDTKSAQQIGSNLQVVERSISYCPRARFRHSQNGSSP
jgi:hypothetical protein